MLTTPFAHTVEVLLIIEHGVILESLFSANLLTEQEHRSPGRERCDAPGEAATGFRIFSGIAKERLAVNCDDDSAR